MAKSISNHRQLEVYQRAFAAAMELFALSKSFPVEERFSLTDQVRRSSRSVCANLAEAWRKRRYEAAFISKLSDAEAEAAETQVGSNLQWSADISRRPKSDRSTHRTTALSERSSG